MLTCKEREKIIVKLYGEIDKLINRMDRKKNDQ